MTFITYRGIYTSLVFPLLQYLINWYVRCCLLYDRLSTYLSVNWKALSQIKLGRLSVAVKLLTNGRKPEVLISKLPNSKLYKNRIHQQVKCIKQRYIHTGKIIGSLDFSQYSPGYNRLYRYWSSPTAWKWQDSELLELLLQFELADQQNNNLVIVW